MKKLILSILAFSLATTALPQQVKEIEILPNEKWWGGCNGCPDTYGYEIESDCIALDDETDEDKKRHCTECWDREAPKEREEPKEMTFAEIEQALGHPVKIVGDSHESDQ